MKKILSKVLYGLAGASIIAILVAVVLGYFVVSFDPATQQYTDGLGRQLGPSPFFMRFVFGQDRLWSGWGWWVMDMLWFWGGGAAAFGFVNLGQKLSKKG